MSSAGRVRKWRARNPERAREQSRRSAALWRERHPEEAAAKARAQSKAYQKAHPEKAPARKRAWYARLSECEKARMNALDILASQLGVPRAAIPSDLIEAKAAQLAVGRATRESDDNA